MRTVGTLPLLALAVVGITPSSRVEAQLPYERILNASNEPESWLTYNGTYSSQRYSKLSQIDRGNVDDLELKWMLPDQVFGAWQSNPDRLRRRDVPDRASQRRHGGRPGDGPRVLAVPLHPVRELARVLRREQPRRGGAGRQGLHGDARRAPHRARPGQRQAALGRAGRGREPGVLDHHGAAGHQGQSDRGRGRRRVRHPRLHRGLRRGDRQRGMALLRDSRARRARARLLGGRRLGPRRRLGLGHRVVRSRPEPHVLGRRQPRSGLEPRAAPRRQPLHRRRGSAGPRHGRAGVALPVHAERRLRLRLRPGAACSPTSTGTARPPRS